MQYILFVLLILMFLFSYYFTGKDILSPMTAQIIIFSFVSLMCIYMLTIVDYKLHESTVIIIASNLFISAVVGVVIHHFFIKVHVKRGTQLDKEASPISNKVHLCVIIYIITMLFWRVLVILRLTGGASGSVMAAFFKVSVAGRLSGEAVLPFGLRQSDHFCDALFIVYGFNLIRFSKQLSKMGRATNLLVMGLCILTRLLGTQRMSPVQNIAAVVMIFHYLRIQKTGKYRVYSLKMIVRLIVIFCSILFVFVQLNNFVGRGTSKIGGLQYLSGYAGAQIINLDIYLQDPGPRSEMFGKYTFQGIILLLDRLGLANAPIYSGVLEFQYINGVSTGNTYGSFRTYYADFGLAGIYVLHFIASVCYAVSYERTKKSLTNERILLSSYMWCGVLLEYYSNCFYGRVFSIGYIENVILILLLYRFFIQKKGRYIKFKRNDQRQRLGRGA